MIAFRLKLVFKSLQQEEFFTISTAQYFLDPKYLTETASLVCFYCVCTSRKSKFESV